MAAQGEAPLALGTLTAPQLEEVQQQMEQEISGFAQQALAIQQMAAKFAAAGQAVEHLQEQQKGGWLCRGGGGERRRRGRRTAPPRPRAPRTRLLQASPCCCR